MVLLLYFWVASFFLYSTFNFIKPATLRMLLIPIDLLSFSFGGGVLRYLVPKWLLFLI
jgi:hypothetical protein